MCGASVLNRGDLETWHNRGAVSDRFATVDVSRAPRRARLAAGDPDATPSGVRDRDRARSSSVSCWSSSPSWMIRRTRVDLDAARPARTDGRAGSGARVIPSRAADAPRRGAPGRRDRPVARRIGRRPGRPPAAGDRVRRRGAARRHVRRRPRRHRAGRTPIVPNPSRSRSSPRPVESERRRRSPPTLRNQPRQPNRRGRSGPDRSRSSRSTRSVDAGPVDARRSDDAGGAQDEPVVDADEAIAAPDDVPTAPEPADAASENAPDDGGAPTDDGVVEPTAPAEPVDGSVTGQ